MLVAIVVVKKKIIALEEVRILVKAKINKIKFSNKNYKIKIVQEIMIKMLKTYKNYTIILNGYYVIIYIFLNINITFSTMKNFNLLKIINFIMLQFHINI